MVFILPILGQAKANKRKFASFTDFESFLAAGISEKTPVFIDQDLGGGVTGLEVARQLSAKGYSNLHIATGFKNIGAKPDYIRSIRGKTFPVDALG